MPSDRHSVPSELDNDQLSEASTITSSNSNNNINDKAKVSPAGPSTETISSPSIPAKVENIIETISNVSTSVTTSDSKVGVDIPLSVSLSTDLAGNMIASGGQHVTLSLMSSCTTSKSTVSSQVPMTSLPEHWQNRFKVVKLVSSEPFKRGRWVCMDFTNPPAVQRDVPKQEVSTEQSSTSGASSAGSSATSLFSENQPLDTVAHFYEIPVSQPYSVAGSISVAVDTPQNSQSIIYLPMNNQVYSAPQVPHMAVVQNFGIQSGQQIVTDSQQQNILSQQGQIVVKMMQNQTSQQQPQHPVQPGQMVPAVSQPLSQPVVQASQTLPQAVVSQQQHPTLPTQPSSGPHTQSIGNIPDVSHTQASQTASSQDQNYQGPSQVTLATVSSDVSMPNVMTSVTATVPPLLEVLPDTLTLGNKSIGEGEEAESASAGSSTVAIDNKIEQAMDLVKSHLMFAVREEVDVLKEKIGELLERISQLEYENGILRSNASQETLNKISQPACQMASQHPPGSTMGAPAHQQASLPGHPQHQNSST
ncbi:uncharacterized protein LOC143232277 isoform X2 [Tachypleus tridentatus]|uniref:uncharacterized protein LOC143232277 isoform X2 n=1 Tax=Tachypleus tridentatus TaxID=6853 RepID=UPI003FD64A7D